VKYWPWYKILVFFGFLLVVVGVMPGAYVVFQLGSGNHAKPLSVPVSLKQGVFTSPEFTSDSSGPYLVELDWRGFPPRQTAVDLDWMIVADNGSVIQQGTLSTILRGANTLPLGQYKPSSGQHQKVVLNVHTDTAGTGVNAQLEVGPQENSLTLSSELPLVSMWALFVALPGALLLLVMLIVKAIRERKAAR